jgi:hypothetical protein
MRRDLFLTSVRTTPQALLRLIRQRWSIENEWHWARDAQLGEDAHRYANRIGAPVFAFLGTVVMNLLRRGGYRSIRQGLSVRRRLDRRAHCIIERVTLVRLLHQCLARGGGHAERCCSREA